MHVHDSTVPKLLNRGQLKRSEGKPQKKGDPDIPSESPAAVFIPQDNSQTQPGAVTDKLTQGVAEEKSKGSPETVSVAVPIEVPPAEDRNPKTLLLSEPDNGPLPASQVALAAGGPGVYQGRIDAINNVKDPVLRNALVTQCYTDTAREFRDCIGADGGTNWCAWASWASEHVGVTIKGQDFPWLKPLAYIGAAAATVVGAAASAVVGGVAGAAAGLAVIGAVEHLSDKTSKAMTHGNDDIFKRTVPNYVRFIETFKDDTKKDPAKLEKFLDEIGPDGPSEEGKYTLLKEAFTSYYEAKFETDPKKKKELVLLGNSQVVWDEQITAQQDVEDAMPVGSRKLLTKAYLTLPLPDRTLRLGKDIPPLPDGSTYPKELETIENPELKGIMDHFGVKDTTKGSGANDYTKIDQRMHFILNFFRTHHEHPTAYDDPFTEKQLPYIRQGLLPPEDGH